MKLLVCYPFTKEQLKKIEGMGFELYLLQNERGPCPEEYMDAEAVICYQLFNYNDISKFKNLRLIQTTSAGLDHMPMEYILSHGISLYNAGGVFSAPMAEFALCGVLQLYKHAPAFARKQRGHVWRQDRGLFPPWAAMSPACAADLRPGSILTRCAP
jgi:phosphoglycerate dehydrogenase-like enzyme